MIWFSDSIFILKSISECQMSEMQDLSEIQNFECSVFRQITCLNKNVQISADTKKCLNSENEELT